LRPNSEVQQKPRPATEPRISLATRRSVVETELAPSPACLVFFGRGRASAVRLECLTCSALPTPAAHAFANKANADVSALQRVTTPGRPAADVFRDSLPVKSPYPAALDVRAITQHNPSASPIVYAN